MNKNLISTLLSQHLTLIKVLKQIEDLSHVSDPSFLLISEKLREFGKLFIEHIYLENKYLYPNIFENCGNDKHCIASVKRILEEMKSVQDTMLSFLNGYRSEEKFSAEFEKFTIELKNVTDILTTRIQFEEDVIFKYYLMK